MACLISRGLAPIDGRILDAGPDLIALSRTGAGYENIDIDAATERGLPVVFAPLLAEAVAEAAAARKRWTFLLTVAPLAVDGGTGSPINPIATF